MKNGPKLRRPGQIGVAEQVHPDHPAPVLVVDLDEADERRDPEEQDDRQDDERERDEALAERGRLGDERERDDRPDSAARNIVARLNASFQLKARVDSRLQCSVVRIWSRRAGGIALSATSASASAGSDTT